MLQFEENIGELSEFVAVIVLKKSISFNSRQQIGILIAGSRHYRTGTPPLDTCACTLKRGAAQVRTCCST